MARRGLFYLSFVVFIGLVLLNSFCTAQEEVNCEQHNSCDSCTDESGCVWCESDSECVEGGFFGPSTLFPSCSDWKYKQCTINGRWYTWYPIFVLLVILLIACCCGLITFFFCNPCVYMYKQWKNKGAYIRWEDMQKAMELEERGPTEEQVRRDSLRKKYNLK